MDTGVRGAICCSAASELSRRFDLAERSRWMTSNVARLSGVSRDCFEFEEKIREADPRDLALAGDVGTFGVVDDFERFLSCFEVDEGGGGAGSSDKSMTFLFRSEGAVMRREVCRASP